MKKGLSKAFASIMTMVLVISLLLVGCGGKDTVTKDSENSQVKKQEETNTQNEKEVSEDKDQWSGTIRVQLIGPWQMESTTDPVTGQKRQGVQVLKDEFEKRYPGATLEYVLMGWDSYTQKTQAMMSIGDCDVYQVPGIASFAEQGLLESLEPLIEKDNFDLGIYIDGQVNGWKAMGPDENELHIYGLPVLGDTRFIVYDTMLFDQWGVEYLSDTPTLEEIEEKAAKMTGVNPVTGEKNYGIMWRGNDSADTVVNIAECKGQKWGTGFKLKDLEFNFNTPEFIEAGQWLFNMKQYAPEGVLTGQGIEKYGTVDNNIAINLREAPMELNNFENTPGLEGRFKAVRLFVNEEEGMGGMFAGSPFAIGKDSENKDLAWEYIKYSSSDFYQEFIFENYQMTPVVNSAFEWESVKSRPNMTVALESMKYLWTPRYPYRAAQPRYILTDAVERFMLGDTTVEEAMNSAQKGAEDWVSELN